MLRFLRFLTEKVNPLKTDVAVQLPGQVDMFLQKDSYNPEDVDPTLSGQAHDDENGRTTADFQSPLIKLNKKKFEDFTPLKSDMIKASGITPASEDATQGGGYVFPQDEVGDAEDQGKKRPDTIDHAGGFSNTSGFGGRTEDTGRFLRIREVKAIGKAKCPVCGSNDFALMPTDFETAKCKNPEHPHNESRLWQIKPEEQKEMVDFAQGLGATDSQYSGSSEKMKLKEKQKPMPFSAQNNYIGGAGNVGNAGNLPQDG